MASSAPLTTSSCPVRPTKTTRTSSRDRVMWAGEGEPHHEDVTTTGERQVLLWIEPGAPPVGRVGTSLVPPVPFAGWLELLARLAQLLEVTHPIADSGDLPEEPT